MKTLECSSKGDKRFSAFYAKVSFNGVVDSIENHYQSVKRDENGNKIGKGKKVDHIIINEHKLNPFFLTPFYKLLWVKYLDNNPDLVAYASEFDDFNDMFRGRSINCQADVIRDYVRYERDYILNSFDVKELISVLKS